MNPTIISAIIGTLGGIAVALVGLLPLYRKVAKEKEEAELAMVQINSMREMLDAGIELYEHFKTVAEESHEREKILQKQIAYIEKQLWIVLSGARKLYAQLVSLGVDPVYEIPDIDIADFNKD